MIKRLLAITVAVKDFDEAVKKYTEFLGIKPRILGPESFPFPAPRAAAFELGGVFIVLETSDQPGNPVAKVLETRGEGVFNVGLEVTNIEQDIEACKAKGLKLVSDKPLETEEFRVTWVHPKSMHGVQWALTQYKVS